MALTMRIGEPTPRRSLAARRRTTKLFTFDDNNNNNNNENENSLNESLTGRRQSRLFNNSINIENINDEPIQTPTQLVDLYQKTLELATQGKINIKNAFDIPLVERLPQVLNVIALDDKDNHNLGPNFVKAGSVIDTSAKIYGFRVDALYTETQKLNGNILNTEEEQQHLNNENNKEENQLEGDNENIDSEQNELKKSIRRIKVKATSFVVNDISKITLEHEFEFRPLQPPNMCQWRGGIGKDSIYAEMVSSTMYSSSDYPLIDGFTNVNSQPDEQQIKINNILNHTITKMIDLISLRDVIKNNETHDHILGNQALRDFSFNEIPSDSFINTIHESCLTQIDESIDKSYINNDEIDNNDDGYNHDELIHAAIEDLNDDPSHTNEILKNALNELSNQDPSSIHSNLGNYQSQQSVNLNLPSTDEILSSSFMSTVSFANQIPNLLHSKDVQSEYSYFDATKLKLFAGPNIWKYTNLLNTTKTTSINNSIIQQQQQQQAPAIRQRINNDGGNACLTGPKRSIRVDFFNQLSINQIMTGISNGRDKKHVGISQSALLLRLREKSLNQTQLARKLRPLNDLINSHNFPQLNFEYLHLINQYREKQIQQDYDHDDFDDNNNNNNFHVTIEHHDNDEDIPLTATMQYDFIRPIHYEKIEFAKGSTSVNAKNLKRQMIEEFTRQKLEQQRTLSLDISTTSQQSSSLNNNNQQPIIEFSLLCENLFDHGHLSLQTDLPSAFYCMLINCNENKLYMKSNLKRDDLYIQECPFKDRRDLSTLSYSYTSNSNLSTTSLIIN
ncbi:unnamed protein product [Rotaria sordida]|uniref:Condensin complex subunit 2 n=1 Tax=Rotaria sordida TaxID=392033 RepID=A0A815FXJ2_9BILA|nr:unnamed protein product [Rotaria sordida]CAF1331210.1 unnamed protein product [Rotaria sordida]